jgi:AcrR family transcriptional regulator
MRSRRLKQFNKKQSEGKFGGINIFHFLCWKIFTTKYFPLNFFNMKDEILQTALRQFLRYGIREMSIQKLIAPLGISTKTVYKYFTNKEELLKEALHLYYVQQYEMMGSFSEGRNIVPLLFDIWYRGIETECKVNKAFFQDLHYYYPELEKKVEVSIRKKIWKQFLQLIHQGIKEGVFKEDIIPEILLHGISAIYTAVARQGQFKDFRVSISSLFLNTIAIYIRGFCTQKGIQLLDEHINAFKIFKGINVSVN